MQNPWCAALAVARKASSSAASASSVVHAVHIHYIDLERSNCVRKNANYLHIQTDHVYAKSAVLVHKESSS